MKATTVLSECSRAFLDAELDEPLITIGLSRRQTLEFCSRLSEEFYQYFLKDGERVHIEPGREFTYRGVRYVVKIKREG